MHQIPDAGSDQEREEEHNRGFAHFQWWLPGGVAAR
jgi:hypothetical protein